MNNFVRIGAARAVDPRRYSDKDYINGVFGARVQEPSAIQPAPARTLSSTEYKKLLDERAREEAAPKKPAKKKPRK